VLAATFVDGRGTRCQLLPSWVGEAHETSCKIEVATTVRFFPPYSMDEAVRLLLHAVFVFSR